MKNLSKIPFTLSEIEERNYSAKFCYFSLDKMGDNSEINERIKTPEEVEEESEANYDNKIILAEAAIEMGANVMPPGFEKIPGSRFLKKSPEKLRKLFIVNGIVNFRGNNSAYHTIGFSDLFPKVSDKQQFLVIGDESYAYGARRSDGKIGYGNPNYKRMEDGVTVSFFIGPSKEEKGQITKNYVSFVKNNKGDEIPPGEKFNYKKLVKDSATYLEKEKIENLTPREERRERREFRRERRKQERRDKRQGRKYKREYSKKHYEKLNIPDKSLQGVAAALEVDLPAIKAIISVESSGKFYATRFEQHIYNKAINGRYGVGDPRKLSTSYGAFQIMGFNYKLAGFSSVEEMVSRMNDPQAQIEAFANYIKNRPAVHRALQRHDWQTFARIYNGPGYAKNNYDNKISTAFNKFGGNKYENLA